MASESPGATPRRRPLLVAAIFTTPAFACEPPIEATTTSATEITGALPTATDSASTSTSSSSATATSTTTTADTDTTTETTAAPGYCGDGMIDDGEACDDGPSNADNAPCTSTCALNVCGDGLVLDGVEECDDGFDNADYNPCTAACTVNVCGDGHVLADVEECDDGPDNADAAACTSICTKNICGDGMVFEGVEECDDTYPQFSGGGDGCSATCTREQVVFVSLKQYDGDLGGPAGADEICADAGAQSIKLPWPQDNNTIFKAWIADPACPPERRFPHADRPYVRIDGDEIAADWDDLIDGITPGDVRMNEYGLWLEEPYNLRVWTAVDGDGKALPDAAAKSCNFWTLAGDSFFGALGRADLGDLAWSRWTGEGGDLAQGCHLKAHLYCVQIACDVYPEYCEPGYCAP